MKKNTLASKLTNDLMAGYSCTEEEIEQYYENHREAFTFVDYLSYTFSPEDNGLTAEECGAAVNRLAAAQNEEEFRSMLGEYTTAGEDEILTTKAGYTDGDAFSQWAFFSGAAGETYTVSDEENQSVTVTSFWTSRIGMRVKR